MLLTDEQFEIGYILYSTFITHISFTQYKWGKLSHCFLLNQAQYGGIENEKEHTHVRDSSQISNMHM